MKRSPRPKREKKTGVSEKCAANHKLINHKLEDADSNDKRARVVRSIRALPKGKVSSYGAIAEAAGWPGAARQVVRILRQVHGLPWHRVVGSGGAIKLPGEGAAEQRFRLRMEGVTFRGMRVDMKRHEFEFSGKKQLHCQPHIRRSNGGP